MGSVESFFLGVFLRFLEAPVAIFEATFGGIWESREQDGELEDFAIPPNELVVFLSRQVFRGQRVNGVETVKPDKRLVIGVTEEVLHLGIPVDFDIQHGEGLAIGAEMLFLDFEVSPGDVHPHAAGDILRLDRVATRVKRNDFSDRSLLSIHFVTGTIDAVLLIVFKETEAIGIVPGKKGGCHGIEVTEGERKGNRPLGEGGRSHDGFVLAVRLDERIDARESDHRQIVVDFPRGRLLEEHVVVRERAIPFVGEFGDVPLAIVPQDLALEATVLVLKKALPFEDFPFPGEEEFAPYIETDGRRVANVDRGILFFELLELLEVEIVFLHVEVVREGVRDFHDLIENAADIAPLDEDVAEFLQGSADAVIAVSDAEKGSQLGFVLDVVPDFLETGFRNLEHGYSLIKFMRFETYPRTRKSQGWLMLFA